MKIIRPVLHWLKDIFKSLGFVAFLFIVFFFALAFVGSDFDPAIFTREGCDKKESDPIAAFGACLSTWSEDAAVPLGNFFDHFDLSGRSQAK